MFEVVFAIAISILVILMFLKPVLVISRMLTEYSQEQEIKQRRKRNKRLLKQWERDSKEQIVTISMYQDLYDPEPQPINPDKE